MRIVVVLENSGSITTSVCAINYFAEVKKIEEDSREK